MLLCKEIRAVAAAVMLQAAVCPAAAQVRDAFGAAVANCIAAGTRAIDHDPDKAIAPVELDAARFEIEKVLAAAVSCYHADLSMDVRVSNPRGIVEDQYINLVFGMKRPDTAKERLHAAMREMARDDRFNKKLNAFYLATAFEFGLGTERNKDAAAYWYRQAAAFGSTTAQNEVRRLEGK